MKAFIFLVLMLFYLGDGVFAQDSTRKIKLYRTWIVLYGNPKRTKGILYETGDSSIVISDSRYKVDYYDGSFYKERLDINKIDQIWLRRNNSVTTGALIGAVAGFLTGGITGYAQGDDPPAEFPFIVPGFTAKEKIFLYGLPVSAAGALLGAMVGSAQIKIQINSSMDEYNYHKERLRRLSVRH